MRISFGSLLASGLLLFSLAGARLGSAAEPPQPVYIYLDARITDHLNLDVTEDRLRRILPMLARYRQQHPEIHISATILFSGAVSHALAERNANTHIKDFVLGFAKNGVVELGYDSQDEPTYRHRPMLELSGANTPEARWLVRSVVAEKLLTQARDPLNGTPLPGATGGLKEMQEVFGPAASISANLDRRDIAVFTRPELGDDSELVHQIRRMNTRAVMFGIGDDDQELPGFFTAAEMFSNSISPARGMSPELYWQANVLRVSESSGEKVHAFRASEGVAAFQQALNKIDRSKVHILHIELGSEKNYLPPLKYEDPLYPPLKVAYLNAEHAGDPTLQLRPLPFVAASQVDKAFAQEDALLKYLVEDFFKQDSGSGFVSNAALKQMTAPGTNFDVPIDGLRMALKDTLQRWDNHAFQVDPQRMPLFTKQGWTQDLLPPYIDAGGRYLSLAETFQVLADAFADFDRTGKFPRSVRVTRVYGPLETQKSPGPSLDHVTLAEVSHICATIAGPLRDTSWRVIPRNSIPSRVTIHGTETNAAQFLRLMAEALVSPSPDAKLTVKATQMVSELGLAEYPRLRPNTQLGGCWTFKPAALQSNALRASR